MKKFEEAAVKFALAKRFTGTKVTPEALSNEIPEYVYEARNVAIAQFMNEVLNPLKGEKLVSYNTETKKFELDTSILEPKKVSEALTHLNNNYNFGNKVLRDIAEGKHDGLNCSYIMMYDAERRNLSTELLTALCAIAFLLFSCYKAIRNPTSLTNFASVSTVLSNPILQSAACLLAAKYIFERCDSSLLSFQTLYEKSVSDFLSKALGNGMLINYQETQLHVDKVIRLRSAQAQQTRT